MDRRTLLIGAGILLVLFALKWLTTVTMMHGVVETAQEDAAEREAREAANPGDAAVPYSEATRASAPPEDAEAMPDWLRDLLVASQPITPAQAEAFLAARGRTYHNLIAASLATQDWAKESGDWGFFTEAQRLDPDGAATLILTLLREQDVSAAEKLKLVSKLAQADPGNAAYAHYELLALHQAGHDQEAATRLQEMVAQGPLDEQARWEIYPADTLAAVGDLHRHLGHDELSAKWAARLVDVDPLMTLPVDVAREWKRSLSESNVPDEEWARDFVDYMQGLKSRPKLSLIDLLVYITAQSVVTSQLEKTQIEGVPAVQYLEIEMASIREVASLSEPLLRTMSKQEAAQYLDIMTEEGELAAMRWAMEQFGHRVEQE